MHSSEVEITYFCSEIMDSDNKTTADCCIIRLEDYYKSQRRIGAKCPCELLERCHCWRALCMSCGKKLRRKWLQADRRKHSHKAHDSLHGSYQQQSRAHCPLRPNLWSHTSDFMRGTWIRPSTRLTHLQSP